MKKTLTLVADRNAGVWTVVHSNPQIRRLFGTYVLPTPWSLERPEADVLDHLRSLNPDSIVRSLESR